MIPRPVDSRRVRDTLFDAWKRAYPVTETSPVDWLAGHVTEADKERGRPPADIKRELEARFETAAKSDPKLAAGRSYAKRYIKEFVRTYHEKSDDALKLK